ncbi:MAG: hypothetical protein OQJ76_03140, partial [Rhodospirillales bacterium]|nr:hypothetical protein [Rhodospirillales bacterium]
FLTTELLQDCYRVEHEKIIENVYSYALLATKTLLLLNGGAAIALLAFFGQTASQNQVLKSGQAMPTAIALATPALWCFLVGAAAAGLVAAAGYLSQLGLLSAMWKDQGRAYYPMTERLADPLQKTAIGLFCIGIGLFISGGIIAGRAIGV